MVLKKHIPSIVFIVGAMEVISLRVELLLAILLFPYCLRASFLFVVCAVLFTFKMTESILQRIFLLHEIAMKIHRTDLSPYVFHSYNVLHNNTRCERNVVTARG